MSSSHSAASTPRRSELRSRESITEEQQLRSRDLIMEEQEQLVPKTDRLGAQQYTCGFWRVVCCLCRCIWNFLMNLLFPDREQFFSGRTQVGFAIVKEAVTSECILLWATGISSLITSVSWSIVPHFGGAVFESIVKLQPGGLHDSAQKHLEDWLKFIAIFVFSLFCGALTKGLGFCLAAQVTQKLRDVGVVQAEHEVDFQVLESWITFYYARGIANFCSAVLCLIWMCLLSCWLTFVTLIVLIFIAFAEYLLPFLGVVQGNPASHAATHRCHMLQSSRPAKIALGFFICAFVYTKLLYDIGLWGLYSAANLEVHEAVSFSTYGSKVWVALSWLTCLFINGVKEVRASRALFQRFAARGEEPSEVPRDHTRRDPQPVDDNLV